MSKAGGTANRILYIKNLSFKVTTEEIFDLFGRYGPIRQIRLGNTGQTRGTAFVVYEDIQDARTACEKLSGFNFMDRYLVTLYHQADKAAAKSSDLEARQAALDAIKAKHNIE